MNLRIAGIAWVLVAVGLLRAALLVAHEPLVGLANQYDMVRTSACVGWYPDLPGDARFRASRAAPIEHYVRGPRIAGECYGAAEDGVVWIATRLATWAGSVERVPLRAVGWVKWTMLAAAAVVLASAFAPFPVASLLHGAIVVLVVADPVVTVWMNTLYTEFTALWALYAVAGALVAIALWPGIPVRLVLLLACGVVALAFSREQFAWLAPALVVVAAPWLYARSRAVFAALLGAASVAAALSYAVLPRPPVIHEVNRADTYLGFLLPASERPSEALHVLGLPPRCERVIGASWYVTRGENLRQACPEALALSSTAFVPFMLAEPVALLRAFAGAVPRLEPAIPRYVGVIAGARFATVDDLPAWLGSPLSHVLSMPLATFAAVVIAALLLLPVAASMAWLSRAGPRARAGWLHAALLSLIVAYSLFTTLLGDGTSEAARHFVPGSVALGAAMLSALVAAGIALRCVAANRRALVVPLAFCVAAAVVIAAAIAWARGQPLAIGMVDEPATREVRGGLALRGWALDPFGVESVGVTLGTRRMVAIHGGATTPELGAIFPAYPDADRGGFLLDVPADELAAAGLVGPVPLRIEVKSRAGPVTTIERRVLDIAP